MQHVASPSPSKGAGRAGGRRAETAASGRKGPVAQPLDHVPAVNREQPELVEVERALARVAAEAATPPSLESIQAVVEQLLGLMTQASVPVVWTVEDVADWLRIPKMTAKLYVVTRADFPAPLRPTGKKDGQRRYFAADVIAWARTAAKGDE